MPLNNPITPWEDNKTGLDCSGSGGAKNRVLTLTYTPWAKNFLVIIGGTPLHRGVGKDYTRDGKDVTFLNEVDNEDLIDVYYSIA